MSGFNYSSFKEAILRVEREKHAELMRDIENVKAFVEKALTLSLECNAHRTTVDYPGVGI